MADSPEPVIRSWPGIAASTLVLSLIVATLAAVLMRAEGSSGLGASDWAAIRFTVLQAVLSAVISVLLAIPVARALARRRFPGRGLLITLLGAPFILPVIVAILGLLAVFGRNGIANDLLSILGLPSVQIYGLHGVVLAHVFFNLPLVTRFLLQGWQAIPAERFRVLASLGHTSGSTFRLLELPMLGQVVPGALLVVFLISTTSFAVALTLGGGPRATTVELAIYQAFRFDFDLSRAALLALVQIGICAAAAALTLFTVSARNTGQGLDRVVERWDCHGWSHKATDALAVSLAALFLLVPLFLIVAKGIPGLSDLTWSIANAAVRSVIVALAATVITLTLALPMALAVHRLGGRRGRMLEATGYLTIAVSPLVIGTGLFILIHPFASPVSLALPVTAVVNAIVSLPFALRALCPAVAEAEGAFGRLADSLGLTGTLRLRIFLWPRLRKPLGFAAGLTAALSMGDLGVVALFADPSSPTLPLAMYQLMGSYRMDAAAGAGLLLLALSLGIFALFDRGGRSRAAI